MATYAAYRHIELDKVGHSKKRVRNPPSDIFNVLCTPTKPEGKMNGTSTPKRNSPNYNSDSFNRLFGNTPSGKTISPRRSSLTKHDVTNRNPVTGNGVDSWDSRNRVIPKIHTERNPVTGEVYTIVSPATTPTKPIQKSIAEQNGTTNVMNAVKKEVIMNGNLTNGQA